MNKAEYSAEINDDLMKRVSWSSIGFAKIYVKDNVECADPLGSGMLIAHRGLKGILTAAHVVEKVLKEAEVGLVTFPMAGTKYQRLKLGTRGLKTECIGKPPFGESGPDIGFIGLPSDIIGQLEVSCVFLNTENHGYPSEPIIRPSRYFCAVVGILGERAIKPRPNGTESLRHVKFEASIEPGNIGKEIETKELDYYDFEPGGLDPTYSFPASYGGVSGGGLLKAYPKANNGVLISIERIDIFGIAFHQSPPSDGGKRTLRCHGPKSIRALLEKLPSLTFPCHFP